MFALVFASCGGGGGGNPWPNLPGGAVPPPGAVWLGAGEEASAQQIKWVVTPQVKAKVQSGELNRLLLYIDSDLIDTSINGTGLSSVQMAMVTSKSDGSNNWNQNDVPFGHGSRIAPEDIEDNILYYILDHTPEYDLFSWDYLEIVVQHGVSGGGLLNLNLVAAFLAPGDPDDPLPPEPVEIGIKITDKTGASETENVIIRPRGGTANLIEVAEEAVGFEFIGGGSGHRSKYPWFRVDFGDKTLADFYQVKFTFEAKTGGGVGSRRLALIANPDGFGGSLTAHATDNSSGGFLASGQVTIQQGVNITTPSNQTVTLSISPSFAKEHNDWDSAYETQNIVSLAIYEHTAAGSVYEITNIEFIERPDGFCDFCQSVSCTCNTAITTVKGLIEGAAYTTTQAAMNTEPEAIAEVERVIAGLALNGVVTEVIPGTFTAAERGTVTVTAGTNGSLPFTVKLNRGNGAEQTTTGRTLTITATAYGADDTAITAIKTLIEGTIFSVNQDDLIANTAAGAKAAVEAIIAELALQYVITEVVAGNFTAAIAGTQAAPDGEDGEFKFTVKLNRGEGAEQITSELVLDIVAAEFFEPHTVWTLAQYFTDNPGYVEGTRISTSSSRPLRTSSGTNTNVLAFVGTGGGNVDACFPSTGAGLDVFVGTNAQALQLNPAKYIYEVSFIGTVKGQGPTPTADAIPAVNAVPPAAARLRLRYEGSGGPTGGITNINIGEVVANTPFEIKAELPPFSQAPIDGTVIRLNAENMTAGNGIIVNITSIEIKALARR
jgi:hypothetical protein